MKTDFSNSMTKLGLYTKLSMTCHAELACLNNRLVSWPLSNFENNIIHIGTGDPTSRYTD